MSTKENNKREKEKAEEQESVRISGMLGHIIVMVIILVIICCLCFYLGKRSEEKDDISQIMSGIEQIANKLDDQQYRDDIEKRISELEMKNRDEQDEVIRLQKKCESVLTQLEELKETLGSGTENSDGNWPNDEGSPE